MAAWDCSCTQTNPSKYRGFCLFFLLMKDKYLLLNKVHSSATYVWSLVYFISAPFISVRLLIKIKNLYLLNYYYYTPMFALYFGILDFFLLDGKQFLPSATWWAVPKLKLGCFAVSLDLKINLIFKNFYWLILERKKGRKRERKTSICFTYTFIGWLCLFF